jgi:hypothetical protein
MGVGHTIMKPNNIREISQESPESRHNCHDHSEHQHCFYRQFESTLYEVTDYGTGTASDVG